MAAPKKYPDELRERAVRLYRESDPKPVIRRNSRRTREEAENALFAYIGGWSNNRRIQARLGWLSPEEYEAD